jgi:hypothetical protein
VQAANAKAAGAADVLIVLDTDGYFSAGADQTIPVWVTGQSAGNALASYLNSHPNTTANVSWPGARQSTPADVLANFSLPGPVAIDAIKPDLQAPGVHILAAVANDGMPGGPERVAVYDGTSMATPHVTGSAGLLFAAHPDWTPAEVKSALMMTAREAGLTKPDGVTPSDYFDRGSGRLQDFMAAHAGLVLNETGLNYDAANPVTGGDPGALNIASFQSHSCVSTAGATCAFTRIFRSTQDHAVTWTVTYSGDAGLTIAPSVPDFSVIAHGKRPLTFSIDASGVAPDGSVHFAEILMTPDDARLPPLHLPVAVAVPPPAIAFDPKPLFISIPHGSHRASVPLTISNVGGGMLDVTNTHVATGTGRQVVIDQPSTNFAGYFASYFVDYAHGSYNADDFNVPTYATNLSKIVLPGFTTGRSLESLVGRGVHFRIYANAGGLPAGGPEGLGSAALYSYDTSIGAPGMSVAGNTITLDLVAAGAPATNLAPGTDWLVAYVDMVYGPEGGFAQYVTATPQGNPAVAFRPVSGDTQWSVFAPAPGFAMHIEQQALCGVSWLSTDTPTATLAAGSSVVVNVIADSNNFLQPSVSGYLCVASDDPSHPLEAVLVKAVQN